MMAMIFLVNKSNRMGTATPPNFFPQLPWTTDGGSTFAYSRACSTACGVLCPLSAPLAPTVSPTLMPGSFSSSAVNARRCFSRSTTTVEAKSSPCPTSKSSWRCPGKTSSSDCSADSLSAWASPSTLSPLRYVFQSEITLSLSLLHHLGDISSHILLHRRLLPYLHNLTWSHFRKAAGRGKLWKDRSLIRVCGLLCDCDRFDCFVKEVAAILILRFQKF